VRIVCIKRKKNHFSADQNVRFVRFLSASGELQRSADSLPSVLSARVLVGSLVLRVVGVQLVGPVVEVVLERRVVGVLHVRPLVVRVLSLGRFVLVHLRDRSRSS